MDRESLARVLEAAYWRANENLDRSALRDERGAEAVRYICHYLNNRAPYTEIQDEAYADKKYSGRTYDEGPVESFVLARELPVRATTAFLTPAFRTKNIPLLPGTDLGGHPWERRLYDAALQLLDDIEHGRLSAHDVLTEIVRNLLLLKRENVQRILSLLGELSAGATITLSSEDIVTLIQQHLSSPKAARLPVLVVAAAYQAVADRLGERALPLQSHHAADSQTGVLGDVEVTLIDDDEVVTSYEMKMKRVTHEDIERTIRKVAASKRRVDNYIFHYYGPHR